MQHKFNGIQRDKKLNKDDPLLHGPNKKMNKSIQGNPGGITKGRISYATFPASSLAHFAFLAPNSVKLRLVSFSPMIGVGSCNSSHDFTGKSMSLPARVAFSQSLGWSAFPSRYPSMGDGLFERRKRRIATRDSSERSRRKLVVDTRARVLGENHLQSKL